MMFKHFLGQLFLLGTFLQISDLIWAFYERIQFLYRSGVANLLETAVGFLKTGFGLFDNNLCNACTGCRHGNMLLTGTI